ncbi:MAG: 4Fe-4S binding protein [Desulfomonile tiedjei]|nr:4Fe-4S binding protein [Desulfomonile tiedjei]
MDAKYVELANRIGLGQSQRIARLFEIIADQNEAELLLALPANAPALAEKLGRSQDEVESMLRTLFVKGVVFPSAKTEPPTYRMCREMVQFHDAAVLWPDAPQEFLDVWQDFMEVEWLDIAKKMSQILPRPFTRVIPVGVSIEAKTHVLAFEDIKEIIDNAKTLSVTKCTCRLTAHKCDKKLEACLQVNKGADYNIARGTGRKLTKEEALEIVRDAELDGLIHVVVNKQNVDHFICNCCPCCCQTMPVLIEHNVSVIEPSRFAADVDPDLCTSCGTCLDRCYFSAISVSEDEPAKINREKCMGCGLCQVTCPTEAISMIEVRETDFVPEKVF